MRDFDFFLYENFDAEEIGGSPIDPRVYANPETSTVLEYVAELPAGSCGFDELCEHFGQECIGNLVNTGFLRTENDRVYIGFPMFLREDAPTLAAYCDASADMLAEGVIAVLPELYETVRHIGNSFPEDLNLYHTLCGRVFDGEMFDILSEHGTVAVSKVHPSGLDYILCAYEKCVELDGFANKLLCSYNRFTDGVRSLESFGDADGARHDFYRFSRRADAGDIPSEDIEIYDIWRGFDPKTLRGELLSAAEKLYRQGVCDPDCRRLLEAFGYADERGICVPVYDGSAAEVTHRVRDIVWDTIGGALTDALSNSPLLDGLLCKRHGVPQNEIANELYHLLFGTINLRLAEKGAVASPKYRPGEGRYHKCILLP